MSTAITKNYELLCRRSNVVATFVPVLLGLEDWGTGASRILLKKTFIDSLPTFYEYRAATVLGEHGLCMSCTMVANLVVGIAEGVAYFDELVMTNTDSAEVFLEEAEVLLSVLVD